MEKQNELIKQDNNKELSKPNEMDSLLQLAISKDLDTDKLEKLIELKTKEDERLCKKDFDFHFTEMQKEFEPIKRTKDSYTSKYAPLELMQRKYGGIIANHGFSFRWREESIENGKRVIFVLSGWGHTDDSTYFDVPKIEGTNQNNDIQVLGIMSAYGKRYTFKSGLGISEEDEDTNGDLGFNDGVQYSDQVKQITSSETVEQLFDVWKKIYSDLKKDNDQIGKKIMTTVYNNKKASLLND